MRGAVPSCIIRGAFIYMASKTLYLGQGVKGTTTRAKYLRHYFGETRFYKALDIDARLEYGQCLYS